MSSFRKAVQGVLDRGGIKGYNDDLRSICKALPHALGEIIYKVVRYHAKHDPQDLVKIAAWAELEWQSANGTGNNAGSAKVRHYTWPTNPELVAGRPDTMPGDPGGGAGGARGGEPAEALYPAFDQNVHVKGRTGAGGRRRRAVGGKHRRRNGKGKP